MRSTIYISKKRYDYYNTYREQGTAYDTGRRLKRRNGSQYFVVKDKSLWDGQYRYHLYLTRRRR